MKKVMVFGTFDIVHPGHLFLFQQSKEYGDYLIVIVAQDETVKEVKGKFPKHNQSQRIEQLKELPIVDKVVLGNSGDKYKIVEDEKPDVICIGYDQTDFVEGLEGFISKKKLNIKTFRLRSHFPNKYKSSKFR